MRKDTELRERTKQFALRVIRLYKRLPRSGESTVIGNQLLRSGTSVAANYREATRGRSNAEVISKLGIVEQELDESLLWLELLVDAEVIPAPQLAPLMDETDQLIRIIVASITTLKNKR
ncbi:MAG: four helix bundle protein [Planctomycetota bacterium]